MADSQNLDPTPAVAPPVVWWLRLEGLAVVILSAIFYARLHAQGLANWWLFAALWLVPDLSFFGYLASPRIGSYAYNTMHTYLLPVALVSAGLLFNHPALLPLALISFNHIGLDRLVGYGLKYPAAFGFTHLKKLGKQP